MVLLWKPFQLYDSTSWVSISDKVYLNDTHPDSFTILFQGDLTGAVFYITDPFLDRVMYRNTPHTTVEVCEPVNVVRVFESVECIKSKTPSWISLHLALTYSHP